MALWQEILSIYGDSCFSMSFEDLADEFGTTPSAIGKSIAAIEDRRSACGRIFYSDGSSKILSKKVKKKKRHCECGCGRCGG